MCVLKTISWVAVNSAFIDMLNIKIIFTVNKYDFSNAGFPIKLDSLETT